APVSDWESALAILQTARDLLEPSAFIDRRSSFESGPRKASNVTRWIQSSAALVNQSSKIDGRADFAGQVLAGNNPKLVIEFFCDDLGGACVRIEMRLLAGDFQVSAAREVAVDVFLANDLVNQI